MIFLHSILKMVEEYRMIFDHDLYHCQAIIYIQDAHGFIIIEASVAVKKISSLRYFSTLLYRIIPNAWSNILLGH